MKPALLLCLFCLLCVRMSSAQEITIPVVKKGIVFPHPLQHEPSFEIYTGKQDRWAINPSPVIRAGFAVPVYLTLVEKPYTVLGCVWFAAPPIHGEKARDEAIRIAALAARDRGADAIILNPQVWARFDFYMSATVVKWGGK